jgi:hypothetical protein
LNIILTIALVVIVRATGSLWFAFALVLLSQWRVFAIRPRFWFAHIQANMISMIVSLSFVVFLYVANGASAGEPQTLLLQILLSIMYMVWLLFLKSQSKRVYVVAQAGVALFAGITAIFSMSYGWLASPVVLLVWLVGFATARQVLSVYDEESHSILLSIIWGLVLSEIGWLAYHWTIAYRLPLLNGFLLPQVSIVMLSLGFLSYKSYDSFYNNQKIRFNDIMLPLIFSVGIITILILAFNGISPGAA